VQDPNSTTNAQYATQDGTFALNAKGQLIQSTTGMYVVGLNGSTSGPITIDTTGMPAASVADGASMTSFTINAQGTITVNLSDGNSFVRGQVLLQNFTDPQALTSVGNNLYSNMNNAGGLATMTAAGSGNLADTTILSGALELSNVDLSAQMADLITAQRAFEANSKIVTTSDELLQTMVNMKR
jgi:flagellar hook protein FlgE